MALLTVPIPWVLQKWQIKIVSRNFQLKCAVVSLFGARNPNRHHGSSTQTCFAVDPEPSMPQPQAEVGNVQSFDKKEQANGMGWQSYSKACICSERVIICSTNCSPAESSSHCSLGHLCMTAQIQVQWTRTPFLSG